MRTASIVLGLLLASGGTAVAADEAQVAQFLATGVCPACDLSGADLSDFFASGIEGSAVDLRAADLSGAMIHTLDLSGARLQGANLTRSEAAFTDFSNADLSGADLSGMGACYDQSFAGASLRGAKLVEAYLCGGLWYEADLAGADLSGADLTLASGLTQAQLDRACGDDATKLNEGLSVRSCR